MMIKKTIIILLVSISCSAKNLLNEKKEQIKEYLFNSNLLLKHKKLLYAQSILETGNFKYVKYNNIFGTMSKISVKHKTVYRLKHFSSLQACIDSRIKRFIKHKHKINKSYASDVNYSNKLNKILRQI
jgi:hypothetical protein